MDKYTSLIQSADSKKLRANMALRKWLKPQNSDGLLSMMTGYYAAVIELDAEFGRVLDTLKRSPEVNDRTIVVFASDHGEMLQSHEMVGKGTWYDEAARVPLLLRVPPSLSSSSGVSGRVYRAASSLTDLYPTLVGLASTKTKPTNIVKYNEKSGEIMTMENNRVDGKDLSVKILKCQQQSVKLTNIDCESETGSSVGDQSDQRVVKKRHRKRRILRVSKHKSEVLSSYNSRIVFSGMKGFWRMATNGHRKVVVTGKMCDPCGDRLFYDLVADPFEMRPRKYTDATSSGNAWYDEGVLELEEALFFWCKTNSVNYEERPVSSSSSDKRLGLCKSNPASKAMYEAPPKRSHNKTDTSSESNHRSSIAHPNKEVATIRNTKKLRDRVAVVFESTPNNEKLSKSKDEANGNNPGGGKNPWWKTQLERQKKAKVIS